MTTVELVESSTPASTVGWLSPSERRIAAALAEALAGVGGPAEWAGGPSVAQLAASAGVSRRHTRRLLRHLAVHGVVEHRPGGGRGHRSSYRLWPRVPDALCDCAKGDMPETAKGDIARSKGGHRDPSQIDTPCQIRTPSRSETPQEPVGSPIQADGSLPGGFRVGSERVSGSLPDGEDAGRWAIGCPIGMSSDAYPVPHREAFSTDQQVDESRHGVTRTSVTPSVTRRRFTSQWCERADALWARSHDS